jgi:hypothetical protein
MLVPIPDLDISLTRYRVISIFPLKNLHRFPLVPLGVFFGLDSTWISPPKFPSDLLKYYLAKLPKIFIDKINTLLYNVMVI